MAFLVLLRYHRLQRHHKIFILVTSVSIFLVSSLTIITGFSVEHVLGQVRFQIAIRALPACQNGIDDDGDGSIDYPADPDCTTSSDTSEGIPLAPPTVVCFARSTSGVLHRSMKWTAIPSNGNGTYTYTWSGTDALTGTTSSVAKKYTLPGTKTASLVVTSGAFSSAITPCVNSILITDPSASSGGGGGGGGGDETGVSGGISSNDLPVAKSSQTGLDETSPLDAAPSGDGDEIPIHNDCTIPPVSATFQDYKNYLVCDGLLTPRASEEGYEYEKYTPRKENLGIAVGVALKDKSIAILEGLDTLSAVQPSGLVSDVGTYHPYHFSDVGLEGQPSWIAKTVQKALVLGIISGENTFFYPDHHATRAESLAMLMNAVCMIPDEHIYSTWQEGVYATAKRYNLTTRSWSEFQPQSPILRQELFVIATKIDLWLDSTGGCIPKSVVRPLPPVLQSAPVITPSPSDTPLRTSSADNSSMSITDSSQPTSLQETQKPGTFVYLYDNEIEKVYAYTVKSGGRPDDVKGQYIRNFGGSKALVRRILVKNLAGEEFAEDRWLIAGETVYVTLIQ